MIRCNFEIAITRFRNKMLIQHKIQNTYYFDLSILNSELCPSKAKQFQVISRSFPSQKIFQINVSSKNSVAESFHGGLLYLSALTGVAAGHLGRALMLTNDAPAVQAGPVEDELDAASDVEEIITCIQIFFFRSKIVFKLKFRKQIVVENIFEVDGDGVLSEDEADLANQIIAAHEQQQAAEVSAILGNGGDDVRFSFLF